uniref:Envelope glycoprotein n=1 Tax=Anser cygnoides TaxID=8845 RepID=A0A8B9DQQ6_ANSCY
MKKEEAKNPQRVGPNQELSGSVLRIQPTQAFGIQTSNSPKPLKVINKSVGQKYEVKSEGMTENNMWRIMNASYYLLNQTNPNVPRSCWLCLDIRPPYYDAIGDLGEATHSSNPNPPQCNWGRDVGITLTEVTGNGRCVGTVPSEKLHLCSITEKVTPGGKEKWLIPTNNARWVCSSTGVTPCLSLKLFNVSQDFCIQVIIVPRILYHSEEYVYTRHTVAEYDLTKREPITAVTLATLIILGGTGVGTERVASLVRQSQEFTSLRVAVDEDLTRVEQSITALEKSLKSLSEVVLQNRRGLDLRFLQQGGLCATLKEECCVYADHTGVVRDTMMKLREGLEKRKRENEARQNWYESWFNYSPWLTTLLSTFCRTFVVISVRANLWTMYF